tara:strand:- start:131 stop:808 length:678 start_codon:yes stop_codon:yes gene_type:complete
MTRKSKIVVLISGNGSNLQSLLEGCHSKIINGEIVAVVSNNPNAFGLKRAKTFGVNTLVIDENNYKIEKKDFHEKVYEAVKQFKPDLVILAGYMKILTKSFILSFQDKIINIHPSLLPKYPGLNTHQRALAARDEISGATVHFVTEKLDSGPIIIQGEVPIFSNDTEQSLRARVLEIEHKIFVATTSLICSGKIKRADDKVFLNENLLGKQGIKYGDSIERMLKE